MEEVTYLPWNWGVFFAYVIMLGTIALVCLLAAYGTAMIAWHTLRSFWRWAVFQREEWGYQRMRRRRF